jgi:hypothetical protein
MTKLEGLMGADVDHPCSCRNVTTSKIKRMVSPASIEGIGPKVQRAICFLSGIDLLGGDRAEHFPCGHRCGRIVDRICACIRLACEGSAVPSADFSATL